MPFDIVIPVYNGEATLARVLGALLPHLLPGDHIFVVDDGSSDHTRAVAERIAADARGRITVLYQSRRGPAAARNRGVRAGRADLLLFLGADILPRSTLLSRHRAVHRAFREHTVGCVGRVTWAEQPPPTPFMVWLDHGGNQNAFGVIAGEQWVDARAFCYGANLSFKRAFLESVGGFDEEHFSSYGWEDLELGMRLARQGGRLYYEPTASARHLHPHTLVSVLDRQRLLGDGAVALERLHPDMVRFPPRPRTAASARLRDILYDRAERLGRTRLAAWASQRFILPKTYAFVTGCSFKKSVQEARSRRRSVDNSRRGAIRRFLGPEAYFYP